MLWWISCNVFSCYVKEKNVGPLKNFQDQYILGVTGPTGQVTFWVSVEACIYHAPTPQCLKILAMALMVQID